jgi:hypothetical protein
MLFLAVLKYAYCIRARATELMECLCIFFIYLLFLYFWFFKTGFLCIPDCPGTHFVDQAGLELRNPPASASQVLALKACATTPS